VGTPTTLEPAVVPNEKVAAVTVVAAVMVPSVIVNVAVWLRNGLCGPLPAIEPLALLNVAPPGGPMIKWAGPVGVPMTFKSRLPPLGLKAQPVLTVPPKVNVPPELTVISWPELEVNVPAVDPLLSVKNRSLRSCPTSVGFASKSVRVTVSVFADVTNVAEALTGLPPIVDPVGVVKVTLLA